MNSAQAKLVVSLLAAFIAVGAWLSSYLYIPGRGFLRSLMLVGVLALLLGRYDKEFRAVSQETPLNQTLIGGIFAGWLLLLLCGLLLAQGDGYRFPTERGINRPISLIVFMLPLVAALIWRFRQIYVWLGARRG